MLSRNCGTDAESAPKLRGRTERPLARKRGEERSPPFGIAPAMPSEPAMSGAAQFPITAWWVTLQSDETAAKKVAKDVITDVL